MAHANTILSQLLALIPRHEFRKLAEDHHEGQALRKINRWDQFVSMFMAQVTGRQSLRDIEANINAQTDSYHLGVRRISKSSLARVNQNQPYTLYEALFGQLLKRCQNLSPRHKFRFKNPLYSLDSSLIELSLALFPWSNHNRHRGAVKLHVGNSFNAVLSQIWIALCAYLLLTCLKFQSKTGWTEQRIMRLLQANLFSKKDLMALIQPTLPPDKDAPPQMALWN